MNTESDEFRRASRHDIPDTVRVVDAMTDKIVGKLGNISETGMLLIASVPLVDDALYAQSKARSLTERGYGIARVRQSLRAAGVDEADGAEAQDMAVEGAADAALRFARRRRIGPYAESAPDRTGREKALASMVRAGHGFELARAVVDAEPGSELDLDDLREKSR